jgi:hypothetical protein
MSMGDSMPWPRVVKSLRATKCEAFAELTRVAVPLRAADRHTVPR